MTLIAGAGETGFAKRKGPVESAQFDFVSGVVCSADGSGILVCDEQNNALRRIDRSTVSTVLSLYLPKHIVWDEGAPIPESAVYITSNMKLGRVTLPLGMCV